jgi:asparagine synthase (glutamine-hydrolysing)
LGRQLKAWALTQRKPVLHLLANTLKAFLPIALVGVPKHERPLPWLDRQFVRRNLAALEGYPSRLRLFGPRPSFAENLLALDGLRRQLACSAAPAAPQYERRFPYLDRDLLEFLYALPREQLVRPHQRRSLMRRALAGIVPHEVLNRKRKAFISRGPLAAFSADLERSLENAKSMISSAQGIVNPDAFAAALQEACSGGEVPLVSLLRTLSLASWIRHMTDSRFWVPSGEAVANPPRPRKLVTDEGGHYLRLVFNVRTNRWSSGV